MTSAPGPSQFGRYRILHKLGEGGMGIVYAAHDDELDRAVAIKTFRTSSDPRSSDRLRREARAAASVSHPNICQIFEIGEHDSQVFIAMELLDGEPLASRIARGPVPLPEAAGIALAVLAALEPLHHRGLIHRDLKPSNIFLTRHGVKLLDFGLARPIAAGEAPTVTLTGTVVGSPGYMAPEQILGEPVDHRADLFAAGVILYEMLVGQPPFDGRTPVERLNAALNEQPPALGGSAAIAGIDRAIRRALAKRPSERFESAEDMAAAVRPALALVDSGEAPRAHRMTRLVVLPFRMLKPDPEIDFLAFSLADAIASTLSGLGSLTVRSSMTASALASADMDLKRLARDAEVDVVLMGTLLRLGNQLRVSAQLVSAADGTILWTESPQVALGDLFQLQDDLSRRLVASLSLPLTSKEDRQLGRDVPASPRAYELFLRANQHFYHPDDWEIARDLYVACVGEDPAFAPAWARLGRCWRMTGKFISTSREDLDANLAKAEHAFRKALELNPDLPIAHNLYTFLEVDLGRSADAVVRLLQQGWMRPNDPDVYAGLVHACRYAGLLDASIAAHERAKQLDPNVPTSAAHAYWMKGNYQEAAQERFGGHTYGYIRALSLVSLGRTDDAIRLLREREQSAGKSMGRAYLHALRVVLEGRPEEAVAIVSPLFTDLNPDPESRFYVARLLARVGELDRAIVELDAVVGRGFNCYHTLLHDPWLDRLRARPEFGAVLRRAEAGLRRAAARFAEAGGERFLGLT